MDHIWVGWPYKRVITKYYLTCHQLTLHPKRTTLHAQGPNKRALINLLHWETSKYTVYLSFLSLSLSPHAHMHYLRSHVHTYMLSLFSSISTFPKNSHIGQNRRERGRELRLFKVNRERERWLMCGAPQELEDLRKTKKSQRVSGDYWCCSSIVEKTEKTKIFQG